MHVEPRFRVSALTGLILAAALIASGCGQKEEPPIDGPVVPLTTTTADSGGDGPGGRKQGAKGKAGNEPSSPEAAVRRTIEQFLTSPNSEMVCARLLTPELLRRAYGSARGCEAARKPPTLAVSAQISGLRVRGTRGDATARPNGGSYDRQRLTFRLTRTKDGWRIARISSDVPVGP